MKHLILAAAAALVFASPARAYTYGPTWGLSFSLGVPAYVAPAPPPPPPPAYYYSDSYAQGYAQGYVDSRRRRYVPPPPPVYVYEGRPHHRHYRGW